MNDEQIAKLAAEQYEKEQSISIRSGEIGINSRFYTFERTALLDGKLLVYLPADFADMPEDLAKIKYPSSDRPRIIKSDERGAATFTFGIVDSPLDEASVSELAAGMRTMLQRLNPAYLFLDTAGTEVLEMPRTGNIEYKSPAIDGTLYNVMYFAPLDGKTMMGTFCCHYDEHEEWRPVVSEILDLNRSRFTSVQLPRRKCSTLPPQLFNLRAPSVHRERRNH
jgi:hypothetical protein